MGEVQGPAISFSEGGGNVWAALCGDASDIGIDVAAAEEFQGGYPLHRVFHDQELRHTLRLTRGDLTKAPALLWSIKEAVVKALGCAFHLVAPRQVHVSPSVGGGRGYDVPGEFVGKGSGAVPPVRRRLHPGPFLSPRGDVAFHRPLEWADSMWRWRDYSDQRSTEAECRFMTKEVEYAIEVEKLTKRYGKFLAVNNISFNVRKGEVFALLGPNGAGKTTTVEIIETIRRPTSGKVRLLGMDVTKKKHNIVPCIGVLPRGSVLLTG